MSQIEAAGWGGEGRSTFLHKHLEEKIFTRK